MWPAHAAFPQDDAACCSDLAAGGSSLTAGHTLLHSSSSQLSCDLEFLLPCGSEGALTCAEELSKPGPSVFGFAAVAQPQPQPRSWTPVGFGRADVLQMIRCDGAHSAICAMGRPVPTYPFPSFCAGTSSS